MRTIAGQIQGFLFPNLNILQSVEGVFLDAWQKQLGAAHPGGATTEAKNIAGNEHFGASFGSTRPLPDLAVDIAVPAGSVMAVQYAVDDLVALLSSRWLVITSSNHRVRTNKLDPFFKPFGVEPDSKGPYELKSVAMSAQGGLWKTVVKGIYHVGHGLSDVPFTITFLESIWADLSYQAYPPTVDADTASLVAEIDALEAIGASLPTGVFGIPLLAFGVDKIDDALAADFKPIKGALGMLQPVRDSIPQRYPVNGTFDNLVFHYDSVSLPQGQLATTDSSGNVAATAPGAVITFLSAKKPAKVPRTGFVTIAGQHNVAFATAPGPNPSPVGPAALTYTAEPNDEVEKPTFTWSITADDPKNQSYISLSGTTGQQVDVRFIHNGKTAPAGSYTLHVTMDDDLHLKDAQGKPPTAWSKIVVTHVSVSVPKPGNNTVPIKRQA